MEDIRQVLKKWMNEKKSYGVCENTTYEHYQNFSSDISAYSANYQYCLYLPRTQKMLFIDKEGRVESSLEAEKIKLEFIFKLYQSERWAAPTWDEFMYHLKDYPSGDLLLDNHDGERPETIRQLLKEASNHHLIATELKVELEEKLRINMSDATPTTKPKL